MSASPAASETPLEFGRRLGAVLPGLAGDVEAVVGAYARACYSRSREPWDRDEDVVDSWAQLRSTIVPCLLLGRRGVGLSGAG